MVETGGSEEQGHPPIYGAFKTLAQDNNNNYNKHWLLFIDVRVSWSWLACIIAIRRCHFAPQKTCVPLAGGVQACPMARVEVSRARPRLRRNAASFLPSSFGQSMPQDPCRLKSKTREFILGWEELQHCTVKPMGRAMAICIVSHLHMQ